MINKGEIGFMMHVFKAGPSVLLALTWLASPLRAQAGPFTLDELVSHVARRVPEARIRTLARQRCLGFVLGPRSESRLRQAGASAQLVRDLRAACSKAGIPPPPPPPPPPATPSAEELIERGDQLRSQGNPAGALAQYRQAAQREPGNAQAHNRVGLALRDQHLYSDALAAFQRAAALRPEASDYHTNVASALNGLRRFQEAEEHARDAVHLNQRSAAAHFQLGVTLSGLNRLPDAKVALAKATLLAPGRDEYGSELYEIERRILNARTGRASASTNAYDVPAINGFVEGIQFYEGPHAGVPYAQRVYRYRFPRDSARSIYYELDLRHPNQSQRVNFEVEAVYTGPRGGEVLRAKLATYVLPEWTYGTSYHFGAAGWDEPGNWQAGTYQVDFLHGGERIASSAFEIVDGPTTGVEIATLRGRVTNLRFYEAGATTPSRHERSYRSRFSGRSSRYISVEVEIAFPRLGQRIDFPLKFIYYAPDGKEFGRTPLNTFAPAGVTTSTHTIPGWGYAEPGRWQAGTYRVDVISGSLRVASGWFDIF